MRKNPFGWDYPAGAENDPRAPWNEQEYDEEPCSCGNEKLLGAPRCDECEQYDAADAAYEAQQERKLREW